MAANRSRDIPPHRTTWAAIALQQMAAANRSRDIYWSLVRAV